MKFKTLDQTSFVLIFDKGDEFIETMTYSSICIEIVEVLPPSKPLNSWIFAR
jgi:hypothetical protein